jgi:ethanolamine utilization cobalamin adenosyltransferase
MKAVTEAYLRKHLRQERPASFTLEPGMILTPAARQFLQDRRIGISQPTPLRPDTTKDDAQSPCTLSESPVCRKKPEEMTLLHGRKLVSKGHPRICLRGRLDSLQSDILLLHARCAATSPRLGADLLELLGWAREILRAEVLEVSPVSLSLAGLTPAELRERSHNPRKFFNSGHLLPEVAMSLEVLELNKLRSTVREIELIAVAALADGSHPGGLQIIESLNRMSSAFYVLMLKYHTGDDELR